MPVKPDCDANYYRAIQDLEDKSISFFLEEEQRTRSLLGAKSLIEIAEIMTTPEAFALLRAEYESIDTDQSYIEGVSMRDFFLIHELTLRYSCHIRFDVAAYGPLGPDELDEVLIFGSAILIHAPKIFAQEGWGSPWDFCVSDSIDFVKKIACFSLETDEGVCDLNHPDMAEGIALGLQDLLTWLISKGAYSGPDPLSVDDVLADIGQTVLRFDPEDEFYADNLAKLRAVLGIETLNLLEEESA